ncbi:MAG: ATP-binding protein [Candidatus Bathyarchaeia archaeon]
MSHKSKNNTNVNENTPIGKTSSPEREPNSTGKFYCWLKDGVVINPFDFVVADNIKGTRTVGIVTEIESLSDAASHLSNYVSSDFGKPTAEPYVERLSSMVAQVNVLRNTGYLIENRHTEIFMPVPGDQKVRFANASDIRFAIGTDLILGKEIPAGVIYQSNGTIVPVSIDSDYTLGPEGAHINVSGISGLATKTSYLMFLILSIRERLQEDVAFVIFNVKQADLLHIDEKGDDLTDEDLKLYKLLDLKPEPFDDVHYFLPRGGDDGQPDSDSPPHEFQIYAYTLADVHSRFDLLFADVPDPYFTLDTFNTRVREDWENGRLVIRPPPDRGRTQQYRLPTHVTTWHELRNLDNNLLQEAYNLHAQTVPRIKRELTRLTSSPLFVNNRAQNEVYLGETIREIEAGEIYVIDIARIPSRTQPFVVGDIMRSIDEMYREGEAENLPKKMIILLDELNTFAPAGSETAIAEQIVEIARKGRSRGTILFGAEQFKSEIHEQIVGNCGTHALGRTGSAEIRKSAYAFLDQKSRQNIMSLGKGEIVLSTPTWRSPIKIRFPRPPYKKMR